MRLLFTDTDSLKYEIRTKDVYEDFSKYKGMFDFSNHSTKSKFHGDWNKLLLGKVKDETASVQIKEFVRLRPKNVFILGRWYSEHIKTKGAKKMLLQQ